MVLYKHKKAGHEQSSLLAHVAPGKTSNGYALIKTIFKIAVLGRRTAIVLLQQIFIVMQGACKTVLCEKCHWYITDNRRFLCNILNTYE